MHKAWFIRVILTAACLVPLTAWADRDGPSWVPEFGMEAGLTAGDSNLVDPRFTGQPANTPSNVYLAPGDTFYLQGYYRQAIGHIGLSFKAAAGGSYACMAPFCVDVIAWAFLTYGNANVDATLGTYQFDNFTGDLSMEYAWDGGRIGGGRSFRTDNYLISNSGANPFKDVHLRPAQGWFVEYEWGRTGVRYTHIIYRSSVSGATINGSNFGIYTHLSFNQDDWIPGGRYFDQGMGLARQGLVMASHPQQWGF
ncbi:MAG TPA: hypothetical protein VGH71_06455 [Gammaproteobacteria bacterium]|jgi:hypothetical protein